MKRLTITLTAVGAVLAVLAIGPDRIAQAQPAKGALAAYERVLEVMNGRFKDMKLVGDPDRDFAALVVAHHEDLIFLARTQLEQGGDERLRRLAQSIVDEQQKQVSELKDWQVRNRQPDYRAKADQPPHGSGPLDRTAAPAPHVQAAAPARPAAQAPVSPLPTVSGTVEKVDAGTGKVTIDHGPIPNLNMDAMTMVFRAQDPALLQGVKEGDKVRFQADRVNGQISVVRIETGREQSASLTQSSAQPTAAAKLPTVAGTVEKVDTGASKITIDHGPIPNLNMDAMTMVFRAQDPTVLKGVKAGDRIRFQADRVNGQISVVRIQKGK